MTWSRPVLCLAAFALTFLLTSLVIYHADIGFEKWSSSSNQTASSQEKIVAPKTKDGSSQEQEMSAEVIFIEPRLVQCQCQFCRVPPPPPIVSKRVITILRPPPPFSSPFSHLGTSRFINLLHPNFDRTSSESETSPTFRQPRIESHHTFHFIRPQVETKLVSPFIIGGSDHIKSQNPKEELSPTVSDSEERVAEMLIEQFHNMMNMDQPNRVHQTTSSEFHENEVSAHMLAIIQRENSEPENDFQNKQEPILDEKELENALREIFQVEDESKSEPDIPDKIRIEDTSKFLDSTTLLKQLIDFENQEKSKSDESSAPQIHEFSYQTFGKNGNEKNFGWTRTYKLRQGDDEMKNVKNIRPKPMKPKKMNKKTKNNNKNRARQARRNQQKKQQEANRCRCRSVCRVCPQKQVNQVDNQIDNEVHQLN